MNNLSLYRIDQEYLDILNKIEDAEGELNPELLELIEINENNFISKTANYMGLIKALEGDISLVEGELARLKKIKDTRERLVTKLKESLVQAMEQRGINKLDTPFYKASLRTSTAVQILDEDNLPNDCYTFKRTVSKTVIKKHLDAGANIPAQLVQNSSITIK